MSKKNFDYFSQFIVQISLCRTAAEQLVDLLENYTDVTLKAEEIHVTEHEGDTTLHNILFELNRSFITPIDREDIVSLAVELDDINDSIEDVANLFDILSIKEVKHEAKIMAKLILEGCSALNDALVEFHNFKRSKKLADLLIQVNKVEEEGDRMYRSSIRTLYQNEKDAIELLKWTQIFDGMEEVLDNCENAAVVIDGLIIKNS